LAAALIALCLTISAGSSVSAGPILDRVRHDGIVKCASFERPGLAIDVGEADAAAADSVGQDPDPTPWHGLNVEICKAVATVVLGSPDKIEFHGLDAPDDMADLTKGDDDIAFLTGREMHMAGIAGRVVPGPIVYVESIAAMVPTSTGAQHLADIDGMKGVCFASGSTLEHVLPGYFARVKKPWRPVGFTEDGEMIDAYNVQQCGVLAGERTTLAMDALEGGVNGLKSTILPEPIAFYPVMATSGPEDGDWSALVAWVVYTLQAGNRPSTDWAVGGAASMPVAIAGLDKDWQAKLLTRVGSYGAMLERTVGAKSALQLPAGLNQSRENGGVLVSPGLE
jgi:general L-amino acid transport system substrate-binding protein